MDDNDELVCLRTFYERTEAALAKAYLEANGIEVMLKADDAGGMFPSMTSTIGHPCILVRAEDAAEAKKLLDEADKNREE
jgi:hypothetical protein